jgi:hypothetical protein
MKKASEWIEEMTKRDAAKEVQRAADTEDVVATLMAECSARLNAADWEDNVIVGRAVSEEVANELYRRLDANEWDVFVEQGRYRSRVPLYNVYVLMPDRLRKVEQ